MRIDMRSALAAMLEEQPKGHLATAADAATHPSPLPIGPQSPPQPKRRERPEPESVVWLRSVIQGDLTTAQRATKGIWKRWTDARGRDRVSVGVWNEDALEYVMTTKVARIEWGSDAQHVVTQSPQHTIARCEADLGLLDLHKFGDYGECVTCDVGAQSCGCCGWGDFPCDTIKTVMSGYRHRDGFKPEWVNG